MKGGLSQVYTTQGMRTLYSIPYPSGIIMQGDVVGEAKQYEDLPPRKVAGKGMGSLPQSGCQNLARSTEELSGFAWNEPAGPCRAHHIA